MHNLTYHLNVRIEEDEGVAVSETAAEIRGEIMAAMQDFLDNGFDMLTGLPVVRGISMRFVEAEEIDDEDDDE